MITPHIKSAKKRLTLAIALAVPLFTMSGASTNLHNANCTFEQSADGQQLLQTCVYGHAANSSWLEWFAGNSRSAHYQFIDLFELVNSHKEDNRQVVLKTREG